MPLNPQRVDDLHSESCRSYATVISLNDSKLVTQMDDGNEQTHSLVEHSRVIKGGRTFSRADVNVGARVMITTRSEDRGVASEVDCIRLPGSS